SGAVYIVHAWNCVPYWPARRNSRRVRDESSFNLVRVCANPRNLRFIIQTQITQIFADLKPEVEAGLWEKHMLPDQLGALLSAYVDGELSQKQTSAVHRLLKHSEAARRLLREFQANAEKLCSLPRVKLAEDFSDTIIA